MKKVQNDLKLVDDTELVGVHQMFLRINRLNHMVILKHFQDEYFLTQGYRKYILGKLDQGCTCENSLIS